MNKIKEQILLFLNNKLLNPNTKKCSLALIGSPGTGKCLDPKEKVIMYDGTMKEAQNVLIGDILMGDDSTPRNVLSVCSGEDEMYRIVPTKGDPFVVNKPHILSLISSRSPIVNECRKENRYRVRWLENGTIKSKY